ncbi:MAG TPA: hypothetical protein VFD19_03770, partial [Clostridia bacterium]|nr:hypothetical protein [Clostridia bacterium]
MYGIGLLLLAQIQFRWSLGTKIPLLDFLFLLPLLAALWTPGYDGFAVGLVAGFLRDYAAGRGYGLGMIVGMTLGLLGSALAREGWKSYVTRGGLLIVFATIVNEWMMSFLGWLIPPGNRAASLGTTMKMSFINMPERLLVNSVCALLLTGYLRLAFFENKKKNSYEGVMSATGRKY